MSNNAPSKNQEIAAGLERAKDLMVFADMAGLQVKKVIVANHEPQVIFEGSDDE